MQSEPKEPFEALNWRRNLLICWTMMNGAMSFISVILYHRVEVLEWLVPALYLSIGIAQAVKLLRTVNWSSRATEERANAHSLGK